MSLRRRLGFVLGIAVVVSFVASIIQTTNNPTAAYFSPLPRVWELALGGLVALGTVNIRRTAGTPRRAAVLGRPRRDRAGGVHLLVDHRVPRLGRRRSGGGGGARDRRRRCQTRVRSGGPSPATTLPMVGIGLLLALPVALARAHHRGATQPDRDVVHGRIAVVVARLPGSGDRHVPLARESHSPQQASRHETLGESGAGWMPRRLEPHRGHRGDPPARARRAGDPRPGQTLDRRRMPSTDEPGSTRPDGDGPRHGASNRGPHPAGRRLDGVHHAAGARGRRESRRSAGRERRGHRLRGRERSDRTPYRQRYEREQCLGTAARAEPPPRRPGPFARGDRTSCSGPAPGKAMHWWSATVPTKRWLLRDHRSGKPSCCNG